MDEVHRNLLSIACNDCRITYIISHRPIFMSALLCHWILVLYLSSCETTSVILLFFLSFELVTRYIQCGRRCCCSNVAFFLSFRLSGSHSILMFGEKLKIQHTIRCKYFCVVSTKFGALTKKSYILLCHKAHIFHISATNSRRKKLFCK